MCHKPLGKWARLALDVMIVLGCFAVLLIVGWTASAADAIPRESQAHRALLVRTVHHGMGLDGPVATLAGQIHQESRWRTDARSPVGAQGLAQFMPKTGDWMSQLYPAIGPADPFNPGWSLRALVAYSNWHLQRLAVSPNVKSQTTPQCERWALALSAYNGGLGWVYKDRDLARASGARGLTWFDDIERFNAGRSAANFAENRHYVKAILLRWEPLYVQAGWGKGVCKVRT